ncbi:MAG: hypothetical protein ABID87_02190 [Chloroflexota bacterium]
MTKYRLAGLLVLMMGLLGVFLTAVSCNMPDFDARLRSITAGQRFSIAGWELRTFGEEVGRQRQPQNAGDAGVVREYFATADHIRELERAGAAVRAGNMPGDAVALETEAGQLEEFNASRKDTVADILARQLRETLAGQGIYHPLYRYLRWRVPFPPLNFRLEKPPHLLVISPRDHIESLREIRLKQDLGTSTMNEMESRVDELGVSSLVVTLGGFGGTYPSFVTDEGDLRFTLETAAEEWLHQYLVFRPLGFRYLLDVTGIARNYEIATINETVAGISSREIAAEVYNRYYRTGTESEGPSGSRNNGFDFNAEMRETRSTVDSYLAAGEIEAAEAYMEARRQFLAAHGYYLRKLNQAYFAFHGTYADRPTSVNPIGAEVRALRAQSASLREFLDTAAVLTSRQALRDKLN